MDFTAATYMAVFDRADSVWAANAANTTVVSALAKSPDAEVAAVSARGRGGRRNRGGARGGASGGGSRQGGGDKPAKPRGPKHPDNAPAGACDLHYKFGKKAWFCADRHNCPWRDLESPKPRHNRNIAATETED